MNYSNEFKVWADTIIKEAPDAVAEAYQRMGLPQTTIMSPGNMMKLYVQKGDAFIASLVDSLPEPALLPLCGMDMVFTPAEGMVINGMMLNATGQEKAKEIEERAAAMPMRAKKGLGLKNLFKRSIDKSYGEGEADNIERKRGTGNLFKNLLQGVVAGAATVGAAKGAYNQAQIDAQTGGGRPAQTVTVFNRPINKYLLIGIGVAIVLTVGIVIYKMRK